MKHELTSVGGTNSTHNGQGNLVTNLAFPNSSRIANGFDSVGRLTRPAFIRTDTPSIRRRARQPHGLPAPAPRLFCTAAPTNSVKSVYFM